MVEDLDTYVHSVSVYKERRILKNASEILSNFKKRRGDLLKMVKVHIF